MSFSASPFLKLKSSMTILKSAASKRQQLLLLLVQQLAAATLLKKRTNLTSFSCLRAQARST
ncbi:UNVERIFIED_CONTAM: hypothetical protein GTU68_058589 [Idotea baltica]|nr:hypothetical protein [Idotea baltica]